MKKQNFEIGFTAETINNQTLTITEIKPRIAKREGVDVKCGLIYVCDIEGETKNLTADRLAQAIGTKQASDKAGFTPANAEALERGFANLVNEFSTLINTYNTKVENLMKRYKVGEYSASFAPRVTADDIHSMHFDFMLTWRQVINDNAKAKEEAKQQAKQAKEEQKSMDIANTLSIEALEALIAKKRAEAEAAAEAAK